MSDGPRFIVRNPDGTEFAAESVEELQERVESEEIAPGADLFDASTGRWSVASETPVFRFLLEELELTDRLPDGFRAAPPEETPSPDADELPGETAESADPAREAEAASSSPDEGDADGSGAPGDDPFDFDLDLVDVHPFESEDEPEDAALADDLPDFDWDGSDGPDTTAPADPEDGEEGRVGRGDGGGAPPAGEAGVPGLTHGSDGFADDGPAPGHGPAPPERDDPWFTPASEGGMLLPGADEEAERWTPEEDEAPPPPVHLGRTDARPRVVGLLVLLGLAGVAGVFFALPETGDGTVEVAEAEVTLPPEPSFPDGLEDAGARVLAGVDAGLLEEARTLRTARGLGEGPPREWLGGFYLANASSFPGVAAFWEEYLGFLGDMRSRDQDVYLESAALAIEREALGEDARGRLLAHFQARYRRQAEYRSRRYDHLAETAGAALELHAVLVRHQAQIRHSPALGGGVSADPILEAVVPEGPTREAVDASLDRVFSALDGSRGGGAPSPDGLATDLFGAFGDAF